MDELLAMLAQFRDERGWGRFHTPPNLAAQLSVEAAELLDVFRWGRPWSPDEVAEETADVLIYALSMCEVLGLDPETIIMDKVARNAQKYPKPEWEGRAW